MGDATKSLAAEIEAVTERERTRLIVWLEEYATPTGNSIDREMTADALMADFISLRLAEIAALQSRAFEDGARWMRERAAKTADYARERAAMALHGSCDGSETNRTRRDLARSLKDQIRALPLQPEGERSDA